MISFDEARALILPYAQPLGTVNAPLRDLSGLVLAEVVSTPHDLPLFDNSAVDGFGVRLSDVASATSESPVRLPLARTVQAGDVAGTALPSGTAVKILTGAPVPTGVEAVVMQEYATVADGVVTLRHSAKDGEHIRRRAEEFRCGDVVLPAGMPVTPPVVGLLASLGKPSARVYRRPRVIVLVTGNELIQPGNPLKPGQIYESNSHSLLAALDALGFRDVDVQLAPDEESALQATLAWALKTADVVISTGGVSVGEFDLLKDGATALGVTCRFWNVAIKPGKPVFFGEKPRSDGPAALLFGLPGNPVAVLVTFYLFVRPVLLGMLGYKTTALALQRARLLTGIRKKPGRLDFMRGVLENNRSESSQPENNQEKPGVHPVDGQGSHMLGGLAQADCLILFPREESELPAGAMVDVLPLDWRLS